MADPQEIGALKASFRGALRTAETLAALQAHIDGLHPCDDVERALLDTLARVSAAHAVAAAALRGFVETMLTRRTAAAE